jgi:magnesium transporter
MMQAFGVHDGRLARLDLTLADFPTTSGLLWIDLSNPSRDEETWVENTLRVQVPTRQEMAEIEESARLYEERGALVMTAVVINGVAEGRPSRTQVTFVLTKTHLVSVRYADPLPFRTFDAKCQRQAEVLTSSDRILVSLLESIVERAADVLEMLAADLNEVSNRLFIEDEEAGRRRKAKRVENELQVLIKRLGRKNIMVSILRESLLSLSRLISLSAGGSQGLAHQRHCRAFEAARP